MNDEELSQQEQSMNVIEKHLKELESHTEPWTRRDRLLMCIAHANMVIMKDIAKISWDTDKIHDEVAK